ncbi:hypothetical protein K525DRAFT_206419 [Schizophyllum commune Loenen D]|nr:hypothetical protein K525DRAFT_206419 [Schizophyllum commune Loenen D]
MLTTTQRDGSNAIRARRRRDRAPVILKIVMQPARELAVHRYLLSPELRDHPQNHTVPIIDEFPFIRHNGEPFLDWMIIVEPALPEMFPYGSLIDLFGQVFVRIRQVIEGLAFMHSNGIAHGDICHQNIYFMSGIEFRDGVPAHPAPPHLVSRAWRPPRFFFLDFGLAIAVSSSNGRLCTASDGGAIMPPELEQLDAALESHTTYDPFAADVYCLGRVINKATAWVSQSVSPLTPSKGGLLTRCRRYRYPNRPRLSHILPESCILCSP